MDLNNSNTTSNNSITNNSNIQNIESKLSNYSLQDENEIISNFIDSPNSFDNHSIISTNSSSSSTNNNNNTSTTLHTENEGLIHGHIHNFPNFTYIHGHIHTNNDSSIVSSNNTSTTINNSAACTGTEPHQHFNEHTEFNDCQHFEFLNCHDSTNYPVISNSNPNTVNNNVYCNEDDHCIPKILEICCDNDHENHEEPYFNTAITNEFDLELQQQQLNQSQPGTNAATTTTTPAATPAIASTTGATANTSASVSANNSSQIDMLQQHNDKLFEHCNFDGCVDVKCGLDTCNIDELYCKLCEDLDESKDIINQLQIKQEEQDKKEMPPCLDPDCKVFKRKREGSHTLQRPHLHVHNHGTHLHHFHPPSQKSVNHHHHHIQIHDHHTKKLKYDNDDNNENESLINFEWNFSNKETKCEWENCNSTLKNSFHLQNHIMENHLLPEYPNSLQNQDEVFDCEWKNCDFNSMDLFSLMDHINKDHGLKMDMKKTSITQTPDSDIFDSTPKTVSSTCSGHNCSSSSSSNNNTHNHTHTHTNNRQKAQLPEQTICKWNHDGDICNKEFPNAEKLHEHVIQDHVGSGKSEYVCHWDGCERVHRSFNQRQKVIRHLHVHTRYKPFVCPVCKYSFAVESMLEQHLRTHSGEKPFKCKLCDKQFATSSSLSIHIRTHTGEKPLVCKYPGCGKRFSESSNLTKHIKIHEKFYKCTCCSRSFSKEKQLVNHMIKYHNGVSSLNNKNATTTVTPGANTAAAASMPSTQLTS